MPKSKNAGRRGARGAITSTPFRTVLSATRTATGTTYTETDLTCANISSRVNDMSFDFEYFRLASLSAYSFYGGEVGGIAAATRVVHGVAFDVTPAAFVITPTSLARFCGFRHAKIANRYETARISVPRGELIRDRPLPWFHTQATGSPDASESSVGTLYGIFDLDTTGTLANAVAVWTVIEGVVEFIEPVDPTLSRARRGEISIPPSVREDPVVKAQVLRLQKAIDAAEETPDGAVVKCSPLTK